MASVKQIQILQTFGFTNSYAESLTNFHAHQLIEQLYHISKTYLNNNRTLLKLSIENASDRYSNEEIDAIIKGGCQ
jgi:hypothetical protein